MRYTCWIIFILSFITNFVDLLNTSNTTDDDVELQFVQMLWRHGDRAALHELYPIYEKDWELEAGGLGELTPLGRSQMNRLGALIREKYVNQKKFLTGEHYSSNEVYIRSTDMNRTRDSAYSFLNGFLNINPSELEWLIPNTSIPIHIDDRNNCVTNVACYCPRYKELQAMESKLPEWTNHINEYKSFIGEVMRDYNFSSTTDIGFQTFPDSLKCIKIHFEEKLIETSPWYNDDFYTKSQEYMGGLKRMIEGTFQNESILNGTDIGMEIKILQGGPILNDLVDRAVQKFECIKTNCKDDIREIKLYAFSSHDQTLYLILSLLGIPQITESLDSWPIYAASMNFEFYTSKTNDDRYFKLLYRKDDVSDMISVTHLIEGCDKNDICPMEVFKKFALVYKPLPNIQTLCTQSATSSSVSTFLFLIFLILQFL